MKKKTVVPIDPAKLRAEHATSWSSGCFYLAHELGHHAHGHVVGEAIVDVARPDLTDDDELERQANDYALKLLLPDHERLIADVREDSMRGQPRLRFKFAVQRVAEAHGVNTALLGMVSAYALGDVAEQKDRSGLRPAVRHV